MTLIVYTNTAGNQDGRDNDLFQIDAAGFLVDMGCVLVDHCSHAVNAASSAPRTTAGKNGLVMSGMIMPIMFVLSRRRPLANWLG